jgi:hypothetical protein
MVATVSIVLEDPEIVTKQLGTLKPTKVISGGNSMVKIPPIGMRFKGVMLRVYTEGE